MEPVHRSDPDSSSDATEVKGLDLEGADENSFNEDTFEQPQELDDDAPDQPAVNFFDSVSHQSQTPLPHNANVAKKTTKKEKRVSRGRTKKSKLWIGVSITSAILIIAGLTSGYLVTRSAADEVASHYHGAIITYLDDVYDATTTPTSDPADIVDSIKGIAAPTLDEAFLGGLVSASYGAALDQQVSTKKAVDDVMSEITIYAGVYTFYRAYQKSTDGVLVINAGINTTSSEAEVTTAFTAIRQKFQDLKTLVDETALPLELENDHAGLVVARTNVLSAWDDLITARNAKNSTAYNAAYGAYQIAASEADSAFLGITSYENGLSAKVRARANELRAYEDSIK